MNRRMPNGTYGGVRGWGREAPALLDCFWPRFYYTEPPLVSREGVFIFPLLS